MFKQSILSISNRYSMSHIATLCSTPYLVVCSQVLSGSLQLAPQTLHLGLQQQAPLLLLLRQIGRRSLTCLGV